jgi:hypothetical protein
MDHDHLTRIAQRAYRAYGAVTEFKNYEGKPMPEWEKLPLKIQDAWRAAAKEAAECSRPRG